MCLKGSHTCHLHVTEVRMAYILRNCLIVIDFGMSVRLLDLRYMALKSLAYHFEVARFFVEVSCKRSN